MERVQLYNDKDRPGVTCVILFTPLWDVAAEWHDGEPGTLGGRWALVEITAEEGVSLGDWVEISREAIRRLEAWRAGRTSAALATLPRRIGWPSLQEVAS